MAGYDEFKESVETAEIQRWGLVHSHEGEREHIQLSLYRHYYRHWLPEKLAENHPLFKRLLDTPFYTGYARFSRPILQEEGVGGIIEHIPVKGRIFLYQKFDNGEVLYGFHSEAGAWLFDPPGRPASGETDLSIWVEQTERMALSIWIEQTERMAQRLLIASRYEKAYLAALGEERDGVDCAIDPIETVKVMERLKEVLIDWSDL